MEGEQRQQRKQSRLEHMTEPQLIDQITDPISAEEAGEELTRRLGARGLDWSAFYGEDGETVVIQPSVERLPSPEEQPEQPLYGKTAAEWHQHLTGDNLAVPCSRYGRNASACAWWAVASLYVYNHFYPGEIDEPEMYADNAMSMAVNDHASLGPFVAEYKHVVPKEVRDNLTMEDIA